MTNATNAAIDVTYVYTITSNGCSATNDVVVSVIPLPVANAGANQSVCAGASVTLATSGFDTYDWDNGVTNNVAFTVTNSTSSPIITTYTLTATNANGCVNTDQVSINVNPIPGAIAGEDLVVCSGTSLTLEGTSCDVQTAGNQNGVTNVADANSGDQIGQSFTATTSGTLSNIQLTLWPFGSPYLLVREYNGSVLANAFGGAIIGTSSVATNMPPVANWQNMSTFEFTNGPALVAGQQYTIEILNYAGAYTGLQDSYAGGESFHTLNAGFAGDMNFVVQVCGSNPNTSYTWDNGVTNNVPFTAINATTNPITTTYNLTATNQYSCTNTDQVDVTVQPTPVVNQQSNITYCGGNMQPGITFTGTTSNTQYVWTSSQNVGFISGSTSLASANPSIGSYYINPTNQVVSNVSVTPQIISGGTTCSGTAMTFTVTVNPTPFVNPVIDQVVCNNGMVAGINLTGTVPTGLNLIAYEGFDYPNNTNISNQSGGIGWAGNWEANYYGNSSMIVNSPGLSYTGLNVTGNKLQWGGPGQYQPHSVRRSVNNPNSGIVYLQFISDFNSSSGGTDRLDLNLAGTTQASFGGNNAQQQMSILAGAQTINSGASVYPLSLVVVQIDYVSNTTKMWVSPTLSSFDYNNPGTPDATYNNAVAFDQVSLTFRSGAQIDEISIYGGPTFNWINDNTSTGLGASGIGNITSFTGTNTGSSLETSNITVTPTLNGCSGTAETFSITVNPTPTVTQPSDQTVCAGTNFDATNFTGTVSGTNYSWSSSNTAVGLAASGTGNIAAFVAPNATNAPISTTVTVTPTFGETGTTFGETSENGTITLTAPTGSVFTSVSYASYGNPTGSNGMYTNGSCHSNTSQSVVEAIALGQTSVTINATDAEFGAPCAGTQSLAVVLAYGPACSGTPKTFTLTVNPVPSLTNQTVTICSGGTFTVSPINGGGDVIPNGTTYSWSAPTVAGITGTTSGTNASSISGALTNTTNAAINVVYTVTPSSATTPACAGTSFTVTVTVEPTPSIIAQTQTICSGSSFAIVPSDGSGNIVPNGTLYSYSFVDNPNVTGEAGTYLSSNGENNLPALQGWYTMIGQSWDFMMSQWGQTQAAGQTFTSQGGSLTGIDVNIQGVSNPGNFTFNLYQGAGITGSLLSTQSVAINTSGLLHIDLPTAISLTQNQQYTFVFSGNAVTANLALTSNQYSGGGEFAANSNGTTIVNGGNDVYFNTYYAQSTPTASIGNTLINLTNTPQVVVYTVIPNSGSCNGTPFTLSVTVNPTPSIISQLSNICSGGAFIVSPANGSGNIVPTGTTYSWTFADNVDITGETIGTNQVNIGQTLTNTTNIDQQVVYSVIPTSGSCIGSSFTVTATINPTPLISNKSESICSDDTFIILPVNGGSEIVPVGTQYTWTVVDNVNVTGDVNQGSAQNSVSQTLTNTSNTVQTVVYTVTPVLPGCNGNTFTVTVTVNPVPSIFNYGVIGCSGTTITSSPTNGSGNIVPIGTTYTWLVNNDNTFVLGETDQITPQSSFMQSLINLSPSPQIVNYTVTPTSASCVGSNFIMSITVDPLPQVEAITGATNVCSGLTTQLASATTGGTWSSSNTSVATVSSTGVVTGVTAGNVTITYTVTSANGCTNTVTASVNVNAGTTSSITAGSATTFCQGGSVTLTANLGTSYLWSNGAQTPTISVTTGGSYYVTVTNASGCSATSTATTVTVNALPVATIVANGPTSFCQGGSVILTAGNGASYSWSNGATSQSIVVTTSNTYSVTITNSTGCIATSLPVAVTIFATPIASINATGATTFCQGGNVTLNANAGSGYTYQWNNFTNNQSLVVTTAGTYTVTVTDFNGCSATSAATTVTVNALPTTASITGSTSLCVGTTTNLATTSVNPTWSSSNTSIATVSATGVVTGVASGSATISYGITDANGCSNTASSVVVVNPLPTATIAAIGSTTFCQGGSVTLLAANAPSGSTYSYVWNLNGTAIVGATANTYVANASGNYSVTITANGLCQATSSATTVTVNSLPILAASTGTTSVCAGSSTALSNATAAGTWSSSNNAVATINSANGLVTGVTAGSAVMTYTFTNANGCSSSTTTNFTVNPLPTATITASGSTTFCQGGSVTLTANTASSYQWSNGATTASITVNASGSYTVTITNANGCSAVSVPTTVTVNTLPSATITANGPTTFCQGGNVTLVASSGASYLWSNGAPTQTISVTAAGTYSVTVTSAAGCTATSTGTIVTVNALPVATINPIGSTTFCQGSLVTLIASAGTSYLWSSGETTQGIIASVDGPYTVTVTNANGCSATSANTNVVVYPLPTVAAITGSNDVCVGSTTVLATTSIGGVWSSSNTAVATISPSGVVTGITAGNAVLSYSITNVNGCTNSVTAAMTVNAGTTATISASGTTTFCAGGSVTLTASSGSSYEWNTGSLNPSITVSASGSYYVNVTNALGCTATSVLTQVVVNPLPVVTAITGSTEVCIGNTTQLANTTNGGVWSSSNNNIATVDANGLVTSVTAGSTTITYTVTNANGCTSSVSAVVNVNALPTTSISANGATTFCAGGSVTLVATTGTSYLWNNGQYTQSITVDTAGTYFATVTNASGCSANTNAITVTVNALPTAVVTANGPTTFCQGNNVLLTATGGSSYSWSTGETTQSILVSTSENIHVDVTNSNGCTAAAANTIVTVLPVTVATITANGPTAICLGSNVTLSATAGTGLTYLWSNGVTTATTQNITVSNAGTYSVTVTNASGCTSTASQTVTVNANPAVTVTANGPTLFCQGGSVTLTATGAASYEWNTGDFTSSITVTTAGSYFVVGTSAAGCETTSATTVVTTSTIPTVAAITGANNVCEGGTINLTSSTINGTWTSANNFIATVSNTGIVTGQNAGTTTITYTVTNGACSNAVTAVVNVLNNPVVPIITASGATTMCPGGTVILFASNGASYQWSNGPLTPFITVNQSGDYAVTVTNASGCSATSLPINVFIGDNTNPVIVPPANITMAPNFGCDAIGVNLGNPTATDNCSVASVSHNAPAIFPLGLTTVTWTVVDGSGNTSTATQFVNVVDNILPTINVNNITVVINDNGSTTITFSDVDNGTTDNCGIASMTLSQYTFGCSNIGDNNITVTVTDNNGNVATTTVLVTVVTSGTDTDNDGTLNACDSDDDGDGINDLDEVVGDTDGDGIPNSVDADDDGDGISTIIEGTDDIDGDGISNYLDSDSDGDGISDDFEWDFGGLGEPGQDCDNDGVYDFLDTDLCGPVIPEAFTPNGNGFNDNFVIPGIEGYTTRSVSIYSRYGTLVYENSTYNNDWDGTLLNTSTQVPDGTYYYIFTFDNGVVVNGYVYINRVQK